jgi:serine/threonine-protein kinase
LPGQVAAFYAQLARCHRELGEPNLANQLFARALELRRAQGDEVGVAASLLDISALRADDGRPQEAIRILRDALAKFRHKVGDRHPLVIELLSGLCTLERSNDALAEAVRDCRMAVSLSQQLHGRGHGSTIEARRQLAALHVDLGRFSEAEAGFREAYAWMRGRVDPDDPDLARVHNSLAIVAWERGDLEHAERSERLAVQIWRNGHNQGLIAAGLFNLAMIQHDAGKDQDALVAVREAGALRRQRFGNRHEIVGDNDRLEGEILATLGRDAEAARALTSAVRLTRAGFGGVHSHTRRAEVSLARFQASHGDASAVERLRLLGDTRSTDIEQRKAAWLARAYAAEADCRHQPGPARIQLDTLLAQMQLALPEGGAVPHAVQHLRATCTGGLARR